MKPITVLAFDTSCDETSVAVASIKEDQIRLLANVVYSHTEVMTPWGGVVPDIAVKQHLMTLTPATQKAIKESGIDQDIPTSIQHIFVTNRPGLVGSLLMGMSFVKGLALSSNIPVTFLDHVECHLYSPFVPPIHGLVDGNEKGATSSSHAVVSKSSSRSWTPPPSYPWISLVASGGHTELFVVESDMKFHWLGGTQDDAAGEAFDKIGKLLGFSYPQGPQVDRFVLEAKKELKIIEEKDEEELLYKIPFPIAKMKGYHFSFSGLKTAVALRCQGKDFGDPSYREERKIIAASAEKAIVTALVQKVRMAQKEYGGHITVSGGVACNSYLRKCLSEAYFPPPLFCQDNAAMVAIRGLMYYSNNQLKESFGSEVYSLRI